MFLQFVFLFVCLFLGFHLKSTCLFTSTSLLGNQSLSSTITAECYFRIYKIYVSQNLGKGNMIVFPKAL